MVYAFAWFFRLLELPLLLDVILDLILVLGFNGAIFAVRLGEDNRWSNKRCCWRLLETPRLFLVDHGWLLVGAGGVGDVLGGMEVFFASVLVPTSTE